MPLSGIEVVLVVAVFVLAILLGQGVGKRAGLTAVAWGGRVSHARLKNKTLSKLPNFEPSSVYVCGRSGIAIDGNMRKLAVTQGNSADILDPQLGLEYRTEERRLAGWDWYYICLSNNGREFAIPFQDPGVRDEWVRKIISL